MVQRREKPGLALEPRSGVSCLWRTPRKNFYRDVAIELGIPSAVYPAHTPFADWLEDLIVGEARSGRE